MYEKLFKIITDIIGAYLKKASGFWGFLLSFVYKIIQKKVVKTGEKIDNKVEAKHDAKVELEKYNEALAKPDLSKEERLKADHDFIGDN